jgi:alpha-tubulin suppressor-like RCC1 family protein
MKAPIIAVGTVLLVLGLSSTPASAQSSTVESWGNAQGPTPIVNTIPGDVTQVVAINSDDYALTSIGTVYAWGSAGSGSLGNGTSAPGQQLTPVQVDFPPDTDITALAPVGPNGTELAIDSNHHVWGWGLNSFGQLCLDNTSPQLKPVELPFSDVSLAVGAGSHATYDVDGTLYSCGNDKSGQLGNGQFDDKDTTTPVEVTGLPDEPVTYLTAGWSDVGALLADGSYWNWGYNHQGQLGDGNNSNSNVPVEVTLPGSVSQVAEGGGAPGDGETVAILGDGSIFGWGSNAWGQLCATPTNKVEQPTAITPPAGTDWTFAATGGTTDDFMDSSGNLWACGDDSHGQFGDGIEKTGAHPVPRRLLSDVTITQVSSTNYLTAVLVG